MLYVMIIKKKWGQYILLRDTAFIQIIFEVLLCLKRKKYSVKG